MYAKPPSDDELGAWGLTREDVATVVSVWAENKLAFELFQFMGTQWRIGMSGAIGLDYTVAFHKMDRMRLPDDQYEALEGDLRTMEFAALRAMQEHK